MSRVSSSLLYSNESAAFTYKVGLVRFVWVRLQSRLTSASCNLLDHVWLSWSLYRLGSVEVEEVVGGGLLVNWTRCYDSAFTLNFEEATSRWLQSALADNDGLLLEMHACCRLRRLNMSLLRVL